MKCHKIAEQCRQNRVCSGKLQEYEQKCAADAMTGRCSGTHRNCQKAVMNILGTELHATCVCKGTDFLHQHDCYTWQKLLWSNPCVIESHLQLHEEINSGVSENLDETFRKMTPAHTTPAPRQPYAHPSPDTDYRRPTNYGDIRYSPQDPRPSETYTHDRSLWRRPGIAIERGHGVGGLGIPFGSINGEGPLPTGQDGRTRIINGLGSGNTGLRFPTEEDETLWPSHNVGGSRVNGGRSRNGDGGRNRNGLSVGGRERGRGPGITIGRGDRGRAGISIGGSERRMPGGDDRKDTGPVLWNTRNRGGGLSVGSERNNGDVFGNNQNGNIYRGRGRPEGGHRGTPISLGEPGRDGGLMPGRQNWMDNLAGRTGGSGGARVDQYPRPNGEDRQHPTRPPIYQPNGRQHHYPITPHVYVAITTTPTPPPTPPSSTTTPATTTSPGRSCTMKTGDMTTMRIPEGSSKRYYKDSDCSELCQCIPLNRDKVLEASCITLACMENKSCNTTRAVYPHTAPYYLAYRGVCVCYSNNFICQPSRLQSYLYLSLTEEYSLGPGIYLFLGYSRGEVEILRPHTDTNEHEAVKVLEAVLIRDYDFKCTLETKHHLGENFIILAKLVVNPESYVSPFLRQRREK
ncbi:uncharacterized protein LOC121873477, partial [Homarus americanus]|uniref:uncharacterized protein LOC121873477 n=1 Tax=Homarus americanus TaxID=6706 RepID=UPI001C46F4F1